MSFLAELKRRNVIRVGIAYLIAAWLIAQVSALALDSFGAPAWAIKTVLFVLVIGFPFAMIFAWAFDLTPDGLRLTRPAPPAFRAPGNTSLDYVLVIGLVVVAALTLWRGLPTVVEAPAVQAGPGPVKAIAVLPFADMSPEGDQEYFGDGMAEQLLEDLARLDGLRVASRTSSFSLNQGDQDISSIAAALNVDYVLEGSVRKDGQRIRVTAQLISAADGYHVWSDVYERELNDIFAVQDEIAASVAGALGVRLQVGNVNAFRGAGTRSVAAYEAYLRGINTGPTSRSLEQALTESISLLERAIEIDPDYAAAWAALGFAIAATTWISPLEETPAIIDRAMDKLLRAVALEPDSAYAKTLLATVSYLKKQWIQSEQYFTQSLSTRTDPNTLGLYATMLMRSGRSTDALTEYARLAAIEPGPMEQEGYRVFAYIATQQYDKAEAFFRQLDGPWKSYFLLELVLNRGTPDEVRAAMAGLSTGEIYTQALYRPVLDRFESSTDVRAMLSNVLDDATLRWPNKQHDVALLAAYFGDTELALRAIEIEVRHTAIRMWMLWYPVMSDVRKLPGFKALMAEINLVDYWRAYGWGDHCRPLANGDFSCE